MSNFVKDSEDFIYRYNGKHVEFWDCFERKWVRDIWSAINPKITFVECGNPENGKNV